LKSDPIKFRPPHNAFVSLDCFRAALVVIDDVWGPKPMKAGKRQDI
jgi:hypothetical protein